MEINAIKNVVRLLASSLFLVVSSTAWSSMAEQPLDPGYYTGAHFPRIDMTNISLNYDKSSKFFTGISKATSTFTLYDPNMAATSFGGVFGVAAKITSNGVLQSGDFSFGSNNSMFGFGMNSQGINKWGNVFSGKLTDVGWSASGDLVEFNIANFSGWACDQGWCTQSERLWFNADKFPTTGWTKDWKDTSVTGTAVIPVPAAVWLLGSGLIGLLMASKRKKSLVSALAA